ncbi:hypothetical protein ACFV1W_20240 [Kitasatospora sp. NPDC059648]|uniref:hypothetical protein n=1 Tax=Kitasatospora sp. NPDC059648 TaxID=3346894 RepID=UPI00368EFA15
MTATTSAIDEALVPVFLTDEATRVDAEKPITTREELVKKLRDAAMAHFPQLGGDNSVRWLIGKLPDEV